MSWPAFWLSLRVTGVALVGISTVGLGLALLLARRRFPGKVVLETILMLPMVLPPTVVGYYLLRLLGRSSLVTTVLHIDILFTWQAAALASMIAGLPLMVQATRAAVEEIDPDIEDAARVDGARPSQVWWFVTLPLARRGITAGLILGGARALGEFGATLMIAGNIPGRTQTLPLAIYDAVQARRYADAQVMVIIMTGLAFSGLWGVRQLDRRPWRLRHGRQQHMGPQSGAGSDHGPYERT